jgi:hypothetical protein
MWTSIPLRLREISVVTPGPIMDMMGRTLPFGICR